MKKIAKWGTVLLALSLSVSCVMLPTANQKPVQNEYRIVDWLGKDVGRTTPEWVKAEQNQESLAKMLGIVDREVFLLNSEGTNLSALQKFADAQDIHDRIASTVQNRVERKTVASTVVDKTNGTKVEKSSTSAYLQQVTKILSSAEYTGLILEKEFWVLKEYYGATGETGKRYSYYALYSIPRDSLKRAIDSAVRKADETSPESALSQNEKAVRAEVMKAFGDQ